MKDQHNIISTRLNSISALINEASIITFIAAKFIGHYSSSITQKTILNPIFKKITSYFNLNQASILTNISQSGWAISSHIRGIATINELNDKNSYSAQDKARCALALTTMAISSFSIGNLCTLRSTLPKFETRRFYGRLFSLTSLAMAGGEKNLSIQFDNNNPNFNDKLGYTSNWLNTIGLLASIPVPRISPLYSYVGWGLCSIPFAISCLSNTNIGTTSSLIGATNGIATIAAIATKRSEIVPAITSLTALTATAHGKRKIFNENNKIEDPITFAYWRNKIKQQEKGDSKSL